MDPKITLYVGIDVGKRWHHAAFVGPEGQDLAKPLRFANTAEGYAAFKGRLEAAARGALVERFGFESRDLVRGVSASEVVSVLQGVDGVLAAYLTELARDPGSSADQAYLPADPTGQGTDGRPFGAELLVLDPSGADVLAVTT